jgi:exonuclease III
MATNSKERNLTVVSYNMHGFNQGFTTVRDLSSSIEPDVFILQEHWLTPSNLSKFENCYNDYFMFGSSAMNNCVEKGILRGRPFGGVMTLIKKSLRNFSQTIYAAERYTIVKVFNCLITNVYLPCAGTPDRLLIIDDVFSDIASHFANFSDCVYLLGGDFNCDLDLNNEISMLINSYITEYKLLRTDELVGSHKTFTYINESLNQHSCLDFFLISKPGNVLNFSVIDEGSNLSDHLPIVIECALVTDLNELRPDGHNFPKQTFLRWDHADTYLYYFKTGERLQTMLSIFDSVISKSATMYKDADLLKRFINSVYSQIVGILHDSAMQTIPAHTKNFYKFWWNQELDCLKEQSIADHKIWKAAGRPRSGTLNDKYRSSKLAYKIRIRECQQQQNYVYTNDLHEALISKRGPAFWKCWRSKFDSKTRHIMQVDGHVNDEDIVENFKLFFEQACSKNSEVGSKNLNVEYNNMRKNYCGMPVTDDMEIDVELIDCIVYHMKRGKAAGLDGLTTEHLQYCHPAVYLLLAKLFNLFMKCGCVPTDFGRSYTVPILKGNKNSVSTSLSVDDFRGITISPVISKVFESCILDRYKQFFVTSDNQFGFKKGLSCSHAIYSVKCVVDHYSRLGSTINLCLLDLKKAFDKMNHDGLYIKLMNRLVPNTLLCILEYWFDVCVSCVRWGNTVSSFISLKCGVRQGGVLSPFLFAIFIDDIIKEIKKTNLGCRLKHENVSIFIYADDIILLAPSIDSLQNMLRICEKELAWLDMSLNPKKSLCIRFGPRHNVGCSNISTVNGDNLLWTTSCRYLGVYMCSSNFFKCSLSNAKKSFYRSFNSIFGKLGRLASEEVILHLVNIKCVPSLLYGLEACSLNKTDTRGLDFVFTRSLMKLFKTSSNVIIDECYTMFNLKCVSQLLSERKRKFLENMCRGNTLCDIVASFVAKDLLTLKS